MRKILLRINIITKIKLNQITKFLSLNYFIKTQSILIQNLIVNTSKTSISRDNNNNHLFLTMSPIAPKEQEQFTLPSQLHKSKLSLKVEKIIKKQNLRSKANIPKMIVDSQHQDIEEQQQQIAKKKAKKWWKSFNKKYFPIFGSLEDAQTTITKIQQLPINGQRLRTFFEEEFCNQNNENYQFLHRKDTIRVLFRRQVALDQKQDHCLLFFELRDADSSAMVDEQTENSFVNINGQKIEVLIKTQEKFPLNVNIWSFRNSLKDARYYNQIKSSCNTSYPDPHSLSIVSMQNQASEIQKLLRHEKQQQSDNSIDHEIKQWTRKYHDIFQKNERFLQILALRIEQKINKRKLQEELRQRQEQIVILTQKQLLWSQILLLFKKGHSDKTEQLLSDALQIITIKEMNMKESMRKKKSTSLQQLKSLFQTDCKICFSTESDQKINKVFYCDGCNTSFHQICYGISKEEADTILNMDKFYCDVCNYSIANKLNSSKKLTNTIGLEQQVKLNEKAQPKQKKPSCQICCKSNFPMKLINNHFYHVTCLFMFDFAEVCDSKIMIKEDYIYESILNRVMENEEQSNFCEFCLKYPGMKFKCSQQRCNKWYHPICAYLNGIQFDLKRNFRKLDVNLYCYEHQLDQHRNIMNQIYIRRFFCDYKKTSNLTEDDFQQQFAKQLTELAKDKAKQLVISQHLLLRKPKMYKSTLPQSSSTLLPGSLKKNPLDNSSYEICQNMKLQQSMAESPQMNQFQINKNEIFHKIDHSRFIEQDLDF